MQSLLSLEVKNYRCLDAIEVELAPLSVLVGPNGGGKSTLLDVIQFLGDSARDDLVPAVQRRGGFDMLRFRGAGEVEPIVIEIKAAVTRHASHNAPDAYRLAFLSLAPGLFGEDLAFRREESFTFKRRPGAGRRLTIRGSQVTVREDGKRKSSRKLLGDQSLALSTLPRLAVKEGGAQVGEIADLFKSFRVFDVDTQAARSPSAMPAESAPRLAQDASNLSAFLFYLFSRNEELFRELREDAQKMIPGFQEIHFRRIGGPQESVVVELEERWLPGRTPLAAASFGTIRALAILALLYDPDPPKLTCVEEIDHGFHPHLFDRLVDLMRRASEHTQLLIATHSPALVNRLRPEELIVCERNPETGGARIPAVDPEEISAMVAATGGALGPGELWFSGSLGGVP